MHITTYILCLIYSALTDYIRYIFTRGRHVESLGSTGIKLGNRQPHADFTAGAFVTSTLESHGQGLA